MWLLWVIGILFGLGVLIEYPWLWLIIIGFIVLAVVIGIRAAKRESKQAGMTEASSPRPVVSKGNAKMLAAKYLESIHQCAAVLNKTTDPQVFFPQFDMLIIYAEELVKTERWVSFTGTTPGGIIRQAEQERDANTTLFLLRSLEKLKEEIRTLPAKAKETRVTKYFDEMQPYSKKLKPEHDKILAEFKASCRFEEEADRHDRSGTSSLPKKCAYCGGRGMNEKYQCLSCGAPQ